MARQIAAGVSPPSCSAITVSGSSAAAAATAATSPPRGDLRAQAEGGAPLAGHEVHVVEDADQAPAGVEHRQVANAVVEHLQKRLGARAVAGDGPCRRAHDLRQRRVRGGSRGHDPNPHVAVGDDAERVALVHHRAGHPVLHHSPRRLPHAGVRGADQRCGPHELAYLAPGGRGQRVALVPREQPYALVHRARHEAGGARQVEHRPDGVAGNPVDERVLRGPGHEAERRLLEQ